MRRRKYNTDLPPCVYLKHGSYFYVKNGKWTNLGKDKRIALIEYAKVATTPKQGMASLLSRWLKTIEVMADNTKAAYTRGAKVVEAAFIEFEPCQISARDVMAFLHHHRSQPSSANTYRTVLIGALDLAFIENLVERNVARDTKAYKMKARDRYLNDAEFAAIHQKADNVLKAMMDLLYLTGQRISDIITIKHADLTDEGIAFKQKKTAHKMIVCWSEELRKAVSDAKATNAKVKGMTLFSNRNGNVYDYSTISEKWRKAARAAGVENARIHDIRAKAATDAKDQGIDSKQLLGHQSESSHNRYLRSKQTAVATPVSFRQKAKY